MRQGKWGHCGLPDGAEFAVRLNEFADTSTSADTVISLYGRPTSTVRTAASL